MERLKKSTTLNTLIAAGLLCLLFLILRQRLIALGIIIGAFVAIGCFHLLARSIFQSTFLGTQNLKPYFFLKYLTRYAIMGTMLFLCAKIDLNLFFGAAAGLLLIPLVLWAPAVKNNAESRTDNN